MEEVKNKLNITQLVFLTISLLLVILSIIISDTFVSWIVFVGMGFGIYVFMSNVASAFKKDMFGIIFTSGSLISILLSVVGIILYINVAETFISTMI